MTALPAGPRTSPGTDTDMWSDLEASMRRHFSDLDLWSVRAVIEAVRAEYAHAHVRAYVHILAERDAVDRLREVRAQRRRPAG